MILVFITLFASTLSYGSTIAARQDDPELQRVLSGSINALIDLQIKPRKGKMHPYYDACQKGDGCKNVLPVSGVRNRFWLPSAPFLPRVTNVSGEWGNSMHFFTKSFGKKNGEGYFSIIDSNMFVTAGVMYPLFFVQDHSQGELKAVIGRALATIDSYKRAGGYSFWKEKQSWTKKFSVIGPPNLPSRVFEVFGFSRWGGSEGSGTSGVEPRPGWARYLTDPEFNPSGAEAVFNIPSDADDTALAIITKNLFGEAGEKIDEDVALFARYRAVDRQFGDGRDAWKGKSSGAYLTWFKSEDLPIKAALEPSTGVIPFGINNVDCVVVANVLLSLGLTKNLDIEGAFESTELLAKAIELDQWPECGLYYPQKMMFPYAAARAYRDGGVSTKRYKNAMKLLMSRLLAEARTFATSNPKLAGAFPGGFDTSLHLSTALATVALLNLGEEMAQELGLVGQYKTIVDRAVAFLIKEKTRVRKRFKDDVQQMFDSDREMYVWEAGVFFSASQWNVAQWRSQPYTVAIVTEALSKYALGWDKMSESLHNISKKHLWNGRSVLYAD